MIPQRLTRHSFNRRHRRLSLLPGGGMAERAGIEITPAVDAALRAAHLASTEAVEPAHYRPPPVNLRDAPSAMEMRAAGWRR